MEPLDTLFGNLLKYPINLRNQVADSFFYDVDALDPAEREALSPLVNLKGTIIVASPWETGGGIRHYKSALGFMLEEGNRIELIAVAARGQLGSRHGRPGPRRRRSLQAGRRRDRHRLRSGRCRDGGPGRLVLLRGDRSAPIRAGAARRAPCSRRRSPPHGRRSALRPREAAESRGLVPDLGYHLGSFDVLGNSDVRTLRDILLAGPPNLRLLVGHSKGNLLISFVLNHMKGELENMADELRDEHHPLFNHLSVVTLGAVVDIPADTFGLKTYQFLGQLDVLGHLKSDRDPPFVGRIAIPHEVVPGVGHHLNPKIPGYLSVEEVLAKVELPSKAEVSARGVSGNGRKAPCWGNWASIIARGRSAVPAA